MKPQYLSYCSRGNSGRAGGGGLRESLWERLFDDISRRTRKRGHLKGGEHLEDDVDGERARGRLELEEDPEEGGSE